MDDELVYFLPFYYEPNKFPKRVKLIHPFGNVFYTNQSYLNNDQTEKVYIEQIKAFAEVTMMDDDLTIDSCRCSNCKRSIDIFDKYCSHCGAKLTERREIHGS